MAEDAAPFTPPSIEDAAAAIGSAADAPGFNPDEVQTLEELAATAAKTEYSLSNRVKGITRRTSKVAIFLDLAAVEKYQLARQASERLTKFAAAEEDQETKDAILQNLEKAEQAEEESKVAMLQGTLSFTLQSIPNVVKEAALRETDKAYRLNDGVLPEESVEAHQKKYDILLMEKVIVEMRDGADPTVAHHPTEKELYDLSTYLDPTQWQRLLNMMQVTVFFDGIGQLATEDPGF